MTSQVSASSVSAQALPNSVMTKNRNSVRCLAIFVWTISLLSAINFVPAHGSLRELNSNLGAFYLLFHLVVTIAFGLLFFRPTQSQIQRAVAFLLQLTLLAHYSSQLLPFYLSGQHLAKYGYEAAFQVKAALLDRVESSNIKAAEEAVRGVGVNLVALMFSEQTTAPAIFAGLPQRALAANEQGRTLAVYSSFDLSAPAEGSFGEDIRPTLFCTLQIGTRVVSLGLASTEFPWNNDATLSNELVLRRLGTRLRHVSGDVLAFVGGGISPFSYQYQKFRKGAYLSNALEGLGLKSSWPSVLPLPGLLVDHIMLRGEVAVESAVMLNIPGLSRRAPVFSLAIGS